MTNAEKRLYLNAVAEMRFKYMCSHPDEMLSIDRFALVLHNLVLKSTLQVLRKLKGNRWITNFDFWRL